MLKLKQYYKENGFEIENLVEKLIWLRQKKGKPTGHLTKHQRYSNLGAILDQESQDDTTKHSCVKQTDPI